PTSRGLPQPIRGLLVNQAAAHKESDTLYGFRPDQSQEGRTHHEIHEAERLYQAPSMCHY
ncbi:hypothetical protein, partial [Corynebacterium marquesiae]|uniref:hypothetical protein n=1 Tax=Corynebacterium marquesiae TaxID=2913503 RepID=UPI0032EC032C